MKFYHKGILGIILAKLSNCGGDTFLLIEFYLHDCSRVPGLVWVQIGHTSTHLLSGIVENSSLKCWHKRCFLLFEVKTFKDTQYLLNIKFKSLHDGPLTINYWHWLHSLQLSEVLICDPSVTWSCCMRIMSQSPAVLMATLVSRGDPSLTINAEPSQLSMTAILSKLYNEQAIYSESHPSMVPNKCVASQLLT